MIVLPLYRIVYMLKSSLFHYFLMISPKKLNFTSHAKLSLLCCENSVVSHRKAKEHRICESYFAS